MSDSTPYPLPNATNNPTLGIGLSIAQYRPATQIPLIDVTNNSTLITSLPTGRIGPVTQTPLIDMTNSSTLGTSVPTGRMINVTNSSTPRMSLPTAWIGPAIQTSYLVNMTNSSTLSAAAPASTEFKNSSGVMNATTAVSTMTTAVSTMTTAVSTITSTPSSPTAPGAPDVANSESNLDQGFVPQGTTITPSATFANPEANVGQGALPQSTTTSSTLEAFMANSEKNLSQGFVPQTNHVSEGTDIAMSISHPVLHQSKSTSSPTEQQDDSQISSQSSYSGLGNAAPDSSPSPAQADLALQNFAQPEHTGFASLPAITSAMAQQVSGPPILILGSQTLTPGGEITVDNTPIYLPPRGSAVVVNGESKAIGSSPTAITIGSNVLTITPLAASPIPGSSPEALTLDGQKLVPGSVITIDNTLVSLPSAGSALVVNGKTIPIDSTATGITIGSQVFPITPAPPLSTALDFTPHVLTLDGQTLERGSVITIDNTPVSLPATGSALIINGETVPIGAGITIGSEVLAMSPNALGAGPIGLVLDGQILNPGGIIKVDDTPISLPPTGSDIIINSKTVSFGSTPTGISIGSQIVSVTPNAFGSVPTALVINGQTIQPGGSVLTVSSGVKVSFPASGTDVVLISGTSTTREPLGPAVLSGLGIAPTGAAGGQASPGSSVDGLYNNGSAMAFTGGGGKVINIRSQELWLWEAMMILGFMFGLWWL